MTSSNLLSENDLFQSAERHFRANKYKQAEPILNQLVLKGCKNALVFHMLGTIYHDRGKFNKAIRSFKRALEIDPSLTDASIGLSIILNDLGKYEEGQRIFSKAQLMLGRQKAEDPQLSRKLSVKHSELGDLYFQNDWFVEALEQFHRAMNLSITHKVELTMKIVECHTQKGDTQKAVQILHTLCKEYPKFTSGRLRLGKIYYDSLRVPDAIIQWEQALRMDPQNAQAKEYLKLTQSMDIIHTEQNVEI